MKNEKRLEQLKTSLEMKPTPQDVEQHPSKIIAKIKSALGGIPGELKELQTKVQELSDILSKQSDT